METILLVEDDAALSEGIALAFSQQPYEFVRCASLAEARQALQTRVFALILLDLGLPDGNGPELVEIGPFRFDFARLRFEKQGVEVVLSRTEQRLLQLLVKNRGQIVPRDTLLDQVWDGGEFVDENTLSVAMRRLRAKLEEDPRRPSYIQTVYGVGYTWKGNADE